MGEGGGEDGAGRKRWTWGGDEKKKGGEMKREKTLSMERKTST